MSLSTNPPTSASITLENAYEDWTVYHTALLLGDKQIADTYKKRALYYRNVFKPGLGFACPRYKDGSWKEEIDLLSTHEQGFIEGNAWNYSFLCSAGSIRSDSPDGWKPQFYQQAGLLVYHASAG